MREDHEDLKGFIERTRMERLARVPEKPDMVQLPAHYAHFKIEPYRFIGENNLGFLEGCIIKYICRYAAKNGVEDVEKAERMCRMLVKKLKGDPDWWKREKVTYEVVENT